MVGDFLGLCGSVCLLLVNWWCMFCRCRFDLG